MIKQLIIICALLICINGASAGEIVTEDNSKVYIYGEIEDFVYMSQANEGATNYNRTVCINATVVEGEISICGADNYELEYNFIADINDTHYVSRILTIKQTLISSGLLTGKVLNRTLTLDGVMIGNYKSTCSFWGKVKKNTVYFNLIDANIRFGSEIIINESLAFTQLNYVDQQAYLPNVTSVYPSFPIYHKYRSVGYDGESSIRLSGLTGVIYNVLGYIPKVGGSVQSAAFLPLSIVQFVFNFIFTFLVIISNNFWYALMVIEIMCIMPALRKRNYSDMVSKYISIHVSIFKFMYEVVILNIINLILRFIEIIRNMFRI